jgi:hypothetical protein
VIFTSYSRPEFVFGLDFGRWGLCLDAFRWRFGRRRCELLGCEWFDLGPFGAFWSATD